MLTVNQILTEQLRAALPRIESTFDSQGIAALRVRQLQVLLQMNRRNWEISPELSFTKFLRFMLKSSKLREITLESVDYGSQTRYVWRRPSAHAVALSIKSKSYLSHHTAVFLQGLSDQPSERIYVNHEQSPKPRGEGLSQESLNRAFANKQRESRLTYSYNKSRIVVLNGMFTDRLGVEEKRLPNGDVLDVTNLERTLVDITVRPSYAGGVNAVLDAFQKAKSQLSIDRFLSILKRLDYVYPYHQAIGFYLEKAGYSQSDWTRFMELGNSFKFYLTHGLRADKKYDATWSLYYPSDLGLSI
jgi:hypothetical protein